MKFSIPNLPIEDWARLAAYIDGEGCMSITFRTENGRRLPGQLIMSVANTDPRLARWLLRFGVGHVVSKYRANAKATRPFYTWRVASRQAAAIIERCLPFFVIKREQAEIAIAYQALKKQRSGISDELMQQQVGLIGEMRELRRPRPLETILLPQTPPIHGEKIQ